MLATSHLLFLNDLHTTARKPRKTTWLLDSACHFLAWEHIPLTARDPIIITDILSALCHTVKLQWDVTRPAI